MQAGRERVQDRKIDLLSMAEASNGFSDLLEQWDIKRCSDTNVTAFRLKDAA